MRQLIAKAINVLLAASMLLAMLPIEPVYGSVDTSPTTRATLNSVNLKLHKQNLIANHDSIDEASLSSGVSLLEVEEQTRAGVVFLASRRKIGRSRDFYSASPHWENVTGNLPANTYNITGGITEFALDPFDPLNRGWAGIGDPHEQYTTAASVWRSDNLNDATPTWTQVLSYSQIINAIGEAAYTETYVWVRRVKASKLQSGLIYALVSVKKEQLQKTYLHVFKSENYGADWTWTPIANAIIDTQGFNATGFEISDHNPYRLWVPGKTVGYGSAYIQVSNDGGHTFSESQQAVDLYVNDIHVPEAENSSDQIGFLAAMPGGQGPYGFRSNNGFASFGQVIFSVLGRNYHMIQSAPSNPQVLYATGLENVQEIWRLYYSDNGGLNWGLRLTQNICLGAVWVLPDSDQEVLTARACDSNSTYPVRTVAEYSSNGGVSWLDKTGNWFLTVDKKPDGTPDVYRGSVGSSNLYGGVTIVDALAIANASKDVVPEEATYCSGSDDLCIGSAIDGTQAKVGGPINTRTGGYDYSFEDISLPTSAGSLAFKRWYSSLTTGIYTTTLGYGWTHSLDSRLIFSDMPGGELGFVFFKAHTANLYRFYDHGDGAFTTYPGLCATLVREQNGETITYTITDKTQVKYVFYGDGFLRGKLQTFTDSQGHTLTYSYDPTSGVLNEVRDESGSRYLSLAYQAGKIQSVSEYVPGLVGPSRSVSFTYTNGELASAVDVLGNPWIYTYTVAGEQEHLLSQITDPGGRIVERTEYDAQGRAVRQFNGSSLTPAIELGYQLDGTTIISETIDGQVSSYVQSYDTRNTLVEQVNAASASEEKGYDANFRPLVITDTLSNPTLYSWSTDGYNLERVENAEGEAVTLAYDSWNNLTRTIDARGIATSFAYSGTLLTQVQEAIGSTTIYTYTSSSDYPQPAGLLKAVRDPLGNVTTYEYDSFGQRIRTIDAQGNQTEYEYDALGRLTVVTAFGRSNWSCYDAAGRITRIVRNASWSGVGSDPCDPLYEPSIEPDRDQISETRYDLSGNAIASIAWIVTGSGVTSRTLRTYYDDANRPEYVVQNLANWDIDNPAPPPESFRTADENITSQTVYDDSGRVIASIEWIAQGDGQETYILTRTTRTYFDALGQPEYVVQNLTGWDVSTNMPPPLNLRTEDENVTTRTYYDAAGNVIASEDPLGRITRTYYDRANRPILVVQNLAGQDVYESRPPDCNRTGEQDTNICTETVYDPNGNVIATIDPNGAVTRTYYDALNRPELTIQNLTSQSYTIDTPPLLVTFSNDHDVATGTAFDANGNAIASVNWVRVFVGDYEQVVSYTTRTYYDELNRPYLVVQNLDPLHGVDNPQPPACNRDTTGDAAPYNVCSEKVYEPDTGLAIAAIDPLGRVTRSYFDGLDRPEWIVRNLLSQGYLVQQPPPVESFSNDHDVASEVIYDAAGRAIANVAWWVESGLVISSTTRTYYDALDRPVAVVRNFAGDLQSNSPPAYDPGMPDRNVRVETRYASDGSQIAAIEWLADETGQVYTRTARTYYDPLGRPALVVQNLDPSWGYRNPQPPACNRDASGLIEPYNICTETLYNAAGEILESRDPLGYSTLFAYDGLGRQTGVTDPLFHTTYYSYDPAGNRVSMLDANGIATRYEYDNLGRLSGVIENYQPAVQPDHQTNVSTEYSYDALGNRLSILDGNNHATAFWYDGLGRLTSEEDKQLAELHWTYLYDVAGNRVKMVDANGASTVYGYDGLNRNTLIDYADPDANVSFAFNALGLRTAMTDSLGTTSWVYDRLGRILSVTDHRDETVGYSYYPDGQRASLTYPDQKTVDYVYDAMGRLARVQDWQLTYTDYRYDVSGRPVGEQKPNGLATEYGYDPAGHLTLLRNTLDANEISSFSYSYDPLGNRTTVTETLLQPAGDLIFADGFESGDFSAWSGVVQGDPADLQVTSAAALFGGYGMQAYPLFRELSLAYDNSPLDETQYRLRVYFDPNDVVVGNSGFHLHTILKLYTSDYEMIGSGSTVALIELQKSGSAYQARIGVRNDTGELGYSTWYDLANAPNALELAWQAASAPGANDGSLELWINGSPAATLSNVDNDSVRVESVALGAVEGVDRGAAGSYCFDAFVSSRGEYIGLEQGQPMACGEVLEAMEGSLELESDALAVEAVAAETMSEALAFPAIPFDWLPWSGLAYLSPTETITVSGFLNTGQWFPGGLPAPADAFALSDGVTVTLLLSATTTLAVEDSGGLFLEQPLDAFTLDAPAEPLAVQSSSTVVIAYTYDPLNRLTAADYDNGVYFHYTYDPAGNRLTQTSSLNQGNPDVYVYDSANRLTSANGQEYTWDNNGNLLDDGMYSYVYDRANRLVEVRGEGVSATYAYNGLGERMQQTVNVQSTDFIVDQAGGLTQVLADGADSYLYGLRRIAEQDAEGWQYYVGDALGSVRQLVDESGEVRLAKGYEPYGEVLNSIGEVGSRYGFTGEWTDGYTNLVYLRARWYAPYLNQFFQRDPIVPNPYHPWEWNRYPYVRNNPINLTDPSGLSPDGDRSGNEVARFIVQRIREDSNSKAIREIYKLNTTHYYEDACSLYRQMSWWEKLSVGGSRFLTDAAYADAGARIEASAWFGCLVADARSRPICGQWDYKKNIRDEWREAQTVDFSVLGINEEVIFYYDIWANFHFGYLGMVGGFSEEALLTGAAIEHAASNLEINIQDDPSDVVANLVGIQLYKFNNLSENTLLWWIYIEKSKLNKAEIDESGNIIRVYR
jgi:RHS repeat-associated protein